MHRAVFVLLLKGRTSAKRSWQLWLFNEPCADRPGCELLQMCTGQSNEMQEIREAKKSLWIFCCGGSTKTACVLPGIIEQGVR